MLDRAVSVRTRVAVLPCCHDLHLNDAGPLRGWMDRPLAVDAMRAQKLERQGYRVWTQVTPATSHRRTASWWGAPQPAGKGRVTKRLVLNSAVVVAE